MGEDRESSASSHGGNFAIGKLAVRGQGNAVSSVSNARVCRMGHDVQNGVFSLL